MEAVAIAMPRGYAVSVEHAQAHFGIFLTYTDEKIFITVLGSSLLFSNGY